MSYNDLRRGRHSEPGRAYFLTTVLADRSEQTFFHFRAARHLVHEMKSAERLGWVQSLAWVIMPDHLHWLFILGDRKPLSEVMRDVKAYSSRHINEELERQGRLWQPGFYDHAIREEEDLRDIARYIVANPLRAGIVSSLGDYPHWDAIWL